MDQTIVKELRKIQKQIKALDTKLDAHISFIESVYKKIFK
jgi:hypothetical protein